MSNDIKLKEGVIRELQEYIHAKIKERGFEDEALHERILLLVEEVGELITAVRHSSGMYVDTGRTVDKDVGEEVADLINFLFAIGIALGLDIEEEFRKKEAKVDKRKYERAKSKQVN